MKDGFMTPPSVLREYLASWGNRVLTRSHRRRSRSPLVAMAEVLETRVMLTATVDDKPVDPAIINGRFSEIVSGNFDDSGDTDYFVWDPHSGENRFVLNHGQTQTILIDRLPRAGLNGNALTHVRAGNFNSSNVDELFFWNPATGHNFFAKVVQLSATSYSASAATGIADPFVNGNDFTEVIVGNFGEDEVADLFFWNPQTGRNRTFYIQDGVAIIEPIVSADGFRTNTVEPTAINGGDFQQVVTVQIGSNGYDDLLFWNPLTGRNRSITLDREAGSSSVGQANIQTNVFPPQAINGNDFTHLVAADFDQNGRNDPFFWNPQTGRNRTGYILDATPTTRVETNNIDPRAINGGAYESVSAANNNGLGELFFWSYGDGGNRLASRLFDGPIVEPPFEEIDLRENDEFIVQAEELVELGQASGTRTIEIEIEPLFDTTDSTALLEDTFLIYLADPDDPTVTLLDGGINGATLFQLSGNQAEFPTELVNFDGTTITIDATLLNDRDEGELRFQLLNTDGDTGSRVRILNVTNIVDPAGTSNATFPNATLPLMPGAESELSGFEATFDLQVNVDNVRVDRSTSQVLADLSVTNNGSTVPDKILVVFSNLPNGVQLSNASGRLLNASGTQNGVPYLNLSEAIPNNGLAAGQTSQKIRLEISNPAEIQFSFAADVFISKEDPVDPPFEEIDLRENNNFIVQADEFVELGQTSGTRTIEIEIEPLFETTDQTVSLEDTFLVYLTDPSNSDDTLLDGGINGTTLFQLSGSEAEFPAELVSFDGSTITIDVTLLADLQEGRLRFQLLNTDGDSGSRVRILDITNSVDPSGTSNAVLPTADPPAMPGAGFDVTSLNPEADLQVNFGNVRFDSSTGQLLSDLSVTNNGPGMPRQIIVTFPDLPDGVQLTNASGTDNGVPYLNLSEAIPTSGLAQGQTSEKIRLEISNPAETQFSFQTAVFSGGPNRAPNFNMIADVQLSPGEVLQIPLVATDPDGDIVTFAVGDAANLPSGRFRADGTLTLRPSPEDIGSYEIVLVATDGLLESTQTLTVDVVPDTVGTTRISGQVLDVDGTALPNVPISLSRLTVLTDQNGRFTLELPSQLLPAERFDISVPTGDPQFDPFGTGQQTIEFRRARYDTQTGTSTDNPRRHPNLVTSFLDGSAVYGSDEDRANALRSLDGSGRLKLSPEGLLPQNNATYFPDGPLENDNSGPNDPTELFVAGDFRSSENPALASLHTVLAREHNRLADEIRTADPSLSGDEVFQQARRLVIAQIQQITFNEYLPLLIGADAISAYTGYDDGLTPGIGTLFTTAAFRIGHSQSVAELERFDANDDPLPGGPLSLRDAFFNTATIIEDGIEPLLRGMLSQQVEQIDTQIIDALRNTLFGPPGSGGLDLGAMSIQRGRDLGLPSYNAARTQFGLNPAISFADITSDTALQSGLQQIYSSVNDIDVFVGGLAEDHVTGAAVGELFQTVIAQQFERIRNSDRLWYENGQLTQTQMDFVRGTTLGSLIARNSSVSEPDRSVFTTGDGPVGLPQAGTLSDGTSAEDREIDGTGNHLASPGWGTPGEHLLIDASLNYADGISEPAGENLASPRVISNAVMDQSESVPNELGLTTMHMFWGQLISHDLSLTPTGTSDTLKINGDLASIDGKEYPFVAERLGLLLEHPVYENVNNVISRPIYLPALDTANATPIDPNANTFVTTAAIPGMQVFVAAGTLRDQQGNAFSDSLSITEVPPDLTPASLPENLLPDLVVTIQPAEMVFTTPAPIRFPNTAGYAPGEILDLWSINPLTGEFEIVGEMQVSSDGSVVNTIDGGIRNSSWHFPAPRPVAARPVATNVFNQDETCGCEQSNAAALGCFGSQTSAATAPGTSRVELHSGAVLEDHALVSYESAGRTWTWSLHYDSLRADPSPIVHFSYDDVASDDDRRLVATLDVKRGDFEFRVPGYTPSRAGLREFGLPEGSHTWRLDESGSVQAALQADLSNLPSGVYEYELSTGLLQLNDRRFAGSTASQTGQFRVVNSTESPFGAGWGLAGLQQLVENPDGSVLLIDGGGLQLYFDAPDNAGEPLVSPPGDFSILEKLGDGTYRRTMKDQTVYEFGADDRLAQVTDRNGNLTQFQYDTDGIISQIIDPAGLKTIFTASNGKVTAITDPADRTTLLEYDADGNLTRVTDPDSTTRTWGYDSEHHITSEIDQRGHLEQTVYDFAGRAIQAIRKDGSEMFYQPLQTQYLRPVSETSNPFGDLSVRATGSPTAQYTDANGRVINLTLDQQGQILFSSDEEGNQGSVVRDDENLVIEQRDGRGNISRYTYDDFGNVSTFTDEVIESSTQPRPVYPGRLFPTAGSIVDAVAKADFNGDGRLDLATANGSALSVSVLFSNGDGTFQPEQILPLGSSPSSVSAADINSDGIIDILTTNPDTDDVSIILGVGGGVFQNPLQVGVDQNPVSLSVGDFDNNGTMDLVVSNGSSGRTSSNQVSVLLGNGNGTFQPQQLLTVGDRPQSTSIEDYNRDGNADFAVTNIGSGDLSIVLGNGDGTFQDQQRIAVGDNPNDLASGDINGDGRIDLVIAHDSLIGSSGNGITVLLGNGDGSFLPGDRFLTDRDTRSVTLGDLNNDGKVDLSIGSFTLIVLLGNGDGTFSAEQSFNAGSNPDVTSIGDFNTDGINDIAVGGSFSGGITVLTGRGNGSFITEQLLTVGRNPSSADAGDFNGDGRDDLVVANESSNDISIFLSNGNGSFESQQRIDVGALPLSVVSGDFNGDLVSDVAVANHGTDDVTVLLATGDGTFQPATSYIVGDGPQTLKLADVNSDNVLDLLVTNMLSDDVSILLGNSDGTFQNQQRLTVGPDPTSLVIGDFNDDQIVDFATMNREGFSRSLSVVLGNGDGTFQTEQRRMLNSGGDSLTTEDFNGDGASDLAIGGFRVLLSNGDGTFQEPQGFSGGDRVTSLSSGDFNQDGLIDIVAANAQFAGVIGPNLAVLTGNGDGTFQDRVVFPLSSDPQSVTVGDFNGDGLPDLVTTNRSSNQVSILLNLRRSGRENAAVPITYTYDSTFNQLTSVKDARGKQTIQEIDPATGNVLSRTRVIGRIDDNINGETDDLVTTYTYTTYGLVDTMTDPLGRVTDYDYNAIGRLMAVTYAVGTLDEAMQSFEYDAAGNQTAVIDENGNRTEFLYDELNRLTRLTEPDPDGNEQLDSPVTEFIYDERGNLTMTFDARGNKTTNTYDPMDRLLTTNDADDNLTQYEYDNFGNLETVIDPLGQTTENTYDSRNRLVKTQDPDNGVTTFNYDLDDNLTSLTDPVGNVTRFAYDARSRMIREIDPLDAATTYRYDATDNLLEKIDRNGRITQFVYDDVNRLLTETWLTADGSTVVNTIDYDYDKASNLTSVGDEFSSLTFTYDNRDRVQTVDNTGTPNTPSVVLTYAYDDVGNVLSVIDTIDGGPGATTTYGYDGLNRTIRVIQDGQDVSDKRVDFGYNPLGQFESIERFSNLTGTQLVAASNYVYDDLNRLDLLEHTRSDDSRIAFYDFTYDADSRITSIDDVDGLTTYSYDDRDQLTGADRDAGDVRGDESYAYDANGNRTNSHRHGDDYDTGPANRLLSDGTFDYEYDAEGNMIRRTEIATGDFRTFDFDHRNRLVRVTDFTADGTPNQEVEFAYGALDRRISKTVDPTPLDDLDEVFTSFVYDREDVLLDFIDTDGDGLNAPNLEKRYLHGPGIDQVLAQEDASTGQTQWLLTDHLGTTHDIVENGGVVIRHIEFDSFGNIIGSAIGSLDTRYLFTGREFDFEVDLQYSRSRYYDSDVGHFLSQDTIGFEGRDTNLYRYVFNAPTLFTDPSGNILLPVLSFLGRTGFAYLGGIGGIVGGTFGGKPLGQGEDDITRAKNTVREIQGGITEEQLERIYKGDFEFDITPGLFRSPENVIKSKEKQLDLKSGQSFTPHPANSINSCTLDK